MDRSAELETSYLDEVLDGSASDIGLWMSDKLGQKNEELGRAIYMLTTFAILEFCQNVIHVGAGFTGLNPLDFTLYRLKKDIVNIQKDVKKILDKHLRVAKDFFCSSMTLMMNKDCNLANNKLERVCEQATEAFHCHSADGLDNITIDTFKKVVESVKLIIFSNILTVSYDRKTEIFIPYVMINSDKKNSIGIELEKWAETCIEQKSKVDITTWFWESSRKKSEAQDELDKILKIAYQFISEARELTDMKTKIGPDQSKVNIKLIPKFLPFGEEDKTELIIGVKEFNSEVRAVVKVFVWREKSTVHCIHGEVKSDVKLKTDIDDDIELTIRIDENALFKHTVINADPSSPRTMYSFIKKLNDGHEKLNIPSKSSKRSIVVDGTEEDSQSFVLNSTGEAAKEQGHCLGEYIFDEELQCFKQRSSFTDDDKPTYAFRYKSKTWFIGDHPCENRGFMQNEMKRDTIPTGGWQFADGSSDWPADPTIKIHFGKLNFPQNIMVQFFGETKKKYPYYDGHFEFSGKWYNGRPVYENEHGRYLFAGNGSGDGSGWIISTEVGRIHLASGGESSLSPEDPSTWNYWDREGYQPASVKVFVVEAEN